MIFSKTSEHAIRILSYYAVNEGGIFSAAYLHVVLDIPFKYLTRLLTKLAKAGFLEPIKGRDGGFILIVPPEKIYLNQIVEVIDDFDNYETCVLGFSKCDPNNPCVLHNKWKGVRESINSFLKETTLKEFKEIPNLRI